MKLNAGILTTKLKETKDFYVNKLGFGVSFENDWYLLLHTPNKAFEISFLLPNLESQAPIFKPPFQGQGLFLTIEVDQVEEWYQKVKNLQIPIELEMKKEEWGDKHFAIADPNGIGIDFVFYNPENKD